MLHASASELRFFAVLLCPAIVVIMASFASLLWHWRYWR
jgi:hypothetical protein